MVERASPKRLAVVRFQPSPAIGNIRVHFGGCSKPKSGRKGRKMRSYVGLADEGCSPTVGERPTTT